MPSRGWSMWCTSSRERWACATAVAGLTFASLACGAGRRAGDPVQPAAAAPTPASGGAEEAAGALVGRDVTDVRVPLLGGEVLALASLAGRPALLVIVATTGVGAEPELAAATGAAWTAGIDRQLARWHARLGPGALPAVHVSLAADVAAVEREWRALTAEWLQGWDPGGAVAARLGVSRLPAALLIGRDGRVAAAWVGAGPRWTDALATQLDQRLEALAAAGP